MKKNTKRSLLLSVLALILCCALLAGTTLAWFTDTASSGVNKIQAGNLDIEVLHRSASDSTDKSIKEETNLFTDVNGHPMNWEPGAVAYETFTVNNEGNLALKYNLKLNIVDYNAVSDTNFTLKNVLKVKLLTGNDMMSEISRDNVLSLPGGWDNVTDTLDVFQKDGGVLMPKGTDPDSEKFQVVVYWQPRPDDNNWNVNNDKTTTDGKPLFIDFGINVTATQKDYESDSFSNNYDQLAPIPDLPANINKTYTAKQEGFTVSSSVIITNPNNVTEAPAFTAEVPQDAGQQIVNTLKSNAGITDEGAVSEVSTEISLKVETVAGTRTDTAVTYNISMSAAMTYTEGGVTKTTTLDSVNTANLTKPVKAELDIGKGLTEVTVKHHDQAMTPVPDTNTDSEGYYYNPSTGMLTIWTKSFSPFTVEYKYDGEAVVGNKLYATLSEAVASAKGGETVTLLKDCTEDVVIPVGKTLTLNLNGKKLTNKTGDTITVPLSSTLTINGNGTVDNVTHARAAIVNNGTVTLNGGAYTRSKEASSSTTSSGGNSYYNILNHGQMTINSGVSVTSTGSFSSLIDNGYFNYADNKNPRSGYVAGTNQETPSLTINGGTFSGGINTVKNDDNAKLTINGGTFGNVTQAVVQNNNVATITGGTFNAANYNALENKKYNETYNQGVLNISGGTFSGRLYTEGGATWNITGGKFSVNPDAKYLANGMITVEADGWYSVIKDNSAKVSTAAELKAVLTAFTDAGSGDSTVTIENDITLKAGETWTPVPVDGYHGAGVVTVEGKGHTIKGLNDALFAGGFAGSSGIVIKDLTLENVNINDSQEKQGLGAFVKNIDSMPKIELTNCHLKNSTITSTGGARVGGLIGWTAGYNNPNDGPVDTYITVKNCSVTDCEITAAGSVGAIIGHAGNNPATFHTITDNTVENCKLHSTDDGGWRVGVVVGTANVGQVTISGTTESGNTLTQVDKTAPAHSNLYGRFVPDTTGKLTIDGVEITQ